MKTKRIRFKRPVETKAAAIENECIHCQILKQIVATIEGDPGKLIDDFVPMVAQALGELIGTASPEERGMLLIRAIAMMVDSCGESPQGGLEIGQSLSGLH